LLSERRKRSCERACHEHETKSASRIHPIASETAGSADKEELRRSLGLDQPILAQFSKFLAGLLRLNLGRSLYEQSGVAQLIAARLPATIELTLCAMIAAVVISFPLAFTAAISSPGPYGPARSAIWATGSDPSDV
jgi:ABC-type dipeptide/oligopeptide/nickel transport system permease component